MNVKNLLLMLSLAACVSCSDSTESIPEVPAVLTYGDYELSCVEMATKLDRPDTLFLSPYAGVTDFEVTVRRRVLSDGVFNGEYQYVPSSEINVTVSNPSYAATLAAGSDTRSSRLSLTAPVNMDYEQAVLSSVTFTVPGSSLSMPIKQAEAEVVIDDDYFVLHTDFDRNVIYLDNKGDVVDFRCALASSMYINGIKDLEYWCDEECTFSYSLEENDWIRVADCVMDPETEGMRVLRIVTEPDPDNGDHPAVLTLRFDLKGRVFEKKVNLLSTEVFHVSFD